MEIILRPIKCRDSYADQVEKPILDWLHEVIYGPLIEYLAEQGTTVHNARTDALNEGLRSGRLWYSDGAFFGQFTAAQAKELRSLGGRFEPHGRVFEIAEANIPADIRVSAIASATRGRQIHQGTLTFLDQVQENLALASTGISYKATLPSILSDLEKQFASSMQAPMKAVEAITGSPVLNPGTSAEMTRHLTENIELSIKQFAVERIPELREKVEANAMAGNRTDILAKIIEADYGVSKRKAAWLAKQETSLFTAKFREVRAKEVGSQTYVWHSLCDGKVRDDHAALDGKTFYWDQPPVVDSRSGRRANPGEDYGCRCIARAKLNLGIS